MINLKYKKSEISIAGDYYQITFDDDHDPPDNYDDLDEVMKSIGSYFLVQFSFEFDGRLIEDQKCYIESDNIELSGYYIVNSVVIGDRSFTIKYGTNDKFVVNITFDATDEEKKELINASKDMFLNVRVNK